jgi:hypothetical protein
MSNKKQQTSSELGRTLAGQWSKQEKRTYAFSKMAEYKKKARKAIKEVQLKLKYAKS